MKIQCDSFNLVAGNDIMLGNAGVYELEYYYDGDDARVYEISTLTGGFSFEPDERGEFLGFEDAEVVLIEGGFQAETHYGDIIRVCFKRELEELKLPVCDSFELIRFYGILRCPGVVRMDSLHLEYVRYLLDIPNKLDISGDCMIRDCPTLKEIPAEWRVCGTADFSYNLNLKKVMAKEFTFLSLSGCENLTALPRGLKVHNDLDLSKCKSLKKLPANLSVGGDLELLGSGIKEIPPTAKIGGNIYR